MGESQYRCDWTNTTTEALPFDLNKEFGFFPHGFQGFM